MLRDSTSAWEGEERSSRQRERDRKQGAGRGVESGVKHLAQYVARGCVTVAASVALSVSVSVSVCLISFSKPGKIRSCSRCFKVMEFVMCFFSFLRFPLPFCHNSNLNSQTQCESVWPHSTQPICNFACPRNVVLCVAPPLAPLPPLPVSVSLAFPLPFTCKLTLADSSLYPPCFFASLFYSFFLALSMFS